MAREECDGPDYATLAAADGLAARVAHIHSSASRTAAPIHERDSFVYSSYFCRSDACDRTKRQSSLRAR